MFGAEGYHEGMETPWCVGGKEVWKMVAGEASERPAVAISACLAGENCTYKCGNHLIAELDELREACDLVYVCPETAGGLAAPRPPAEHVGGRVMLATGEDVTAQFEAGAASALASAREAGCRFALLKERSPSCGFGRIYDGTFSGALVEGDGMAARMMADAGIEVFGESRVDALLRALGVGR